MKDAPSEEVETLIQNPDSPKLSHKSHSRDSISQLDLVVKCEAPVGKALSHAEPKSEAEVDKISDTPLFPLKVKEFTNILFMLVKAGIPTSATYIASYIKGLVCLAFVGKYGTPEELAGASLATSIGNLFLVSILYCLNQGFGVMASHLYGANKHKDIGLLFQRHLCVLIAISAPILLVMAFSDVILNAVGTNPEVSRCTGIYMRYIIPSMIALYLSDFAKCFLMAQKNFFMAGAMQVLLLVIHIFWCLLFVFQFDMPFTGPAIAKSITDVSCAIVLLLYIKFKDSIQKCRIPFTKQCLRHWFSHVKETMTIGFSAYVGYILFEFSLLIVVYLNDEYVQGAHSLAIMISSSFYMLSSGNNLTMQAFLGNAMGEGRKYKAQKIVTAGLFLNALVSLFAVVIMLVFKNQIISLFTDVPETQSILTSFLYINCVQYPADTYKGHLSGILRMIGREREVFKVLVFCYLVIGINAQWILSLVLGIGYMGVWIGISLALYVTTITFVVYLVKTDWDQEVARIREKMKVYKSLPASRDEL